MGALHVAVSKHLLNEDFTVVWANDFFYEMAGYSREEYDATFHGSVAAYFEGDQDEFRQMGDLVMAARESGQPGYECIVRMPRKGGDHMWIRVSGMFSSEAVSGVPVIYSTFANVNDAMLTRREQSVSFGNLPGFAAKYRVTPEGPQLLYGNKRFAEFFGYRAYSDEDDLFDVNMKINDEVIASHFDAMRAGEPVSFEVEALGANETAAYFTIVGDCIDRIDGDPVYLVLYFDTTDLAMQQRQAEEAAERLRRLAFVDEVTGGRNRASFEEAAEAAVSAAPPCTYVLVSVDVDKFKVINDLYGLEEGDSALKTLYQSFAARLAEDEFAGRISADEFNLLLRAGDREALAARLEDMARDANEAIGLDEGHSYVLTMKAGVCLVDDPAMPMMRIRDCANIARKRADDGHAGEVCSCRFYSDEDRMRLAREKDIENRMRPALAAGEFVVYLQPKLDLRTNVVKGAEALVRWADPTCGVVPPDDFVPLFERNGFIIDLDLCVFRQACSILRAWLVAGERPLTISVNLSRAHLADPLFLDRFEDIRKECGVPASLLEIELTETLVFENPKLLADVIDRIHRAGYGCSMDDFGSGYSSLNVLKDLEVDTLKLDRAFFGSDGPGPSRASAVVDVVIELAQRLHMTTVAEGVETQEQRDYLEWAGCDLMQGYLFSRPLPVDEFERLVFGHAVAPRA